MPYCDFEHHHCQLLLYWMQNNLLHCTLNLPDPQELVEPLFMCNWKHTKQSTPRSLKILSRRMTNFAPFLKVVTLKTLYGITTNCKQRKIVMSSFALRQIWWKKNRAPQGPLETVAISIMTLITITMITITLISKSNEIKTINVMMVINVTAVLNIVVKTKTIASTWTIAEIASIILMVKSRNKHTMDVSHSRSCMCSHNHMPAGKSRSSSCESNHWHHMSCNHSHSMSSSCSPSPSPSTSNYQMYNSAFCSHSNSIASQMKDAGWEACPIPWNELPVSKKMAHASVLDQFRKCKRHNKK